MLLRTIAALVAILISFNPVCTVAQTPADEALMHWQLDINKSRIDRLRALAPQMMPDCSVEASDVEIANFFTFWRRVAKAKVTSLEEADLPDYTSPRTMGDLQISATMSLRELEKVNLQTPGALAAAKKQIEIWHLNRCVDTQFHGAKYDGWYGYKGDTSPGNIPTTFEQVPNTDTGMMVPSMGDIEPISALGKFFHAAQDKGLLKFSDPREEAYFFYRYDSDYFFNVAESAVTKRWFAVAPWANG